MLYFPLCITEMRPKWFDHEDIPWDDMWPDDRLWYPYIFDDKYFNGYFKFDGMDTMLEQKLTERGKPFH